MSPSLKSKIIEKIKLNRISTTEVADCMNKSGLFIGADALNHGHFRVGPVFWAYAYNESNWELHEQLLDVQPGDVVLIDAVDCGKRALFGSLVSKFLMLYKRVEAIVTNAYLRDGPHLIKENWPIWCAGTTPIGCFNVENEPRLDDGIVETRRAPYEDAIAVCDDSGVVIVPEGTQTEAFLEKLDFIERQEDIWFYCIDTLKWDTFRTVCKKEYLNDEKIMGMLEVIKGSSK